MRNFRKETKSFYCFLLSLILFVSSFIGNTVPIYAYNDTNTVSENNIDIFDTNIHLNVEPKSYTLNRVELDELHKDIYFIYESLLDKDDTFYKKIHIDYQSDFTGNIVRNELSDLIKIEGLINTEGYKKEEKILSVKISQPILAFPDIIYFDKWVDDNGNTILIDNTNLLDIIDKTDVKNGLVTNINLKYNQFHKNVAINDDNNSISIFKWLYRDDKKFDFNVDKTIYVDMEGIDAKLSDLVKITETDTEIKSITLNIPSKMTDTTYLFDTYLDGEKNIISKSANIKDIEDRSVIYHSVIKNKKGKINYELNGGKLTPNGYEMLLTTYDKSFTLPTPKKEGYKFLGWFVKGKNNEYIKLDKIEKNNELFMGDVLVEAKFYKTNTTIKKAKKLDETYFIEYDLDGGEFTAKQTKSLKTEFSGKKIVKLPTPKRYGYDFLGWFMEDNQGNLIKVTKLGYKYTNFSEGHDISVKAMWTPKKYTINFEKFNGKTIPSIITYFDYPTFIERCTYQKDKFKFVGYEYSIKKNTYSVSDIDMVYNLNNKNNKLEKSITLIPTFDTVH